MIKFIFSEYDLIPITENHILQLHRMALDHSYKDKGHKGIYKIAPNRVEAKDADGKVVGIIFDPTSPHLVKKKCMSSWSGLRNPLRAKGIYLLRL